MIYLSADAVATLADDFAPLGDFSFVIFSIGFAVLAISDLQ
jgi:hypothetical protein